MSLSSRLNSIHEWANDWGVDFNVGKTKHICFGSRRTGDVGLRMGQESVKSFSEVKYLGVYFDSMLNFKFHVTQHLLPRLRKNMCFMRHITKKLSHARASFIRNFWQTKLQSQLDYGAHVWFPSAPKILVRQINSLQFEFLRSGFGAPKFVNRDLFLTDISVVRADIRLKTVHLKYSAYLRLNFVPSVVSVAHDRLIESSPACTKFMVFPAPTVKEAITARNNWVLINHSSIRPRVSHPNETANSLMSPCPTSKYGFRLVYPNPSVTNPWKALVRVAKTDLSSFEGDLPGVLKDVVTRTSVLCSQDANPSKSLVKRVVREWSQQSQMESVARSTLSEGFRKFWYRDPLVHTLPWPTMRLVRKLRLRCSFLRAHVPFMNNNDSTCRKCLSGDDETTEHFLFKCPAFHRQRYAFLHTVESLGLLPGEVSTPKVLGFDPKLVSPKYERRTRERRVGLMRALCCYIDSTKRLGST